MFAVKHFVPGTVTSRLTTALLHTVRAQKVAEVALLGASHVLHTSCTRWSGGFWFTLAAGGVILTYKILVLCASQAAILLLNHHAPYTDLAVAAVHGLYVAVHALWHRGSSGWGRWGGLWCFRFADTTVWAVHLLVQHILSTVQAAVLD